MEAADAPSWLIWSPATCSRQVGGERCVESQLGALGAWSRSHVDMPFLMACCSKGPTESWDSSSMEFRRYYSVSQTAQSKENLGAPLLGQGLSPNTTILGKRLQHIPGDRSQLMEIKGLRFSCHQLPVSWVCVLGVKHACDVSH